MNRIENDLAGASVELFSADDKKLTQKVKECIDNKNYRFVIFCLDNASQIEKVICTLSNCYTRSMKNFMKKICVIHDEADQVTKNSNIQDLSDDQAQSHQKWIELFSTFKTTIEFKRVFVTATPENCVMLYNIDCPDIMMLEKTDNYTGYDKIDCIPFVDDLEIKDIIIKEVVRIQEQKTLEAILYCTDRKIDDGQTNILYSLANLVPNCVVSTYNGKGLSVYTINLQFPVLLEQKGYVFQRFDDEDNFYQIPKMTIRKFYKLCKQMGEKCVITIGKDLMSRGISYVGDDKDLPISATTMIYKPGKTMHAVGLCQAIGRITGMARPELKRRLYAPQNVIDTYKVYNQNQEQYIQKIMQQESGNTKDVINNMTFQWGYKRSIDRKPLGLKMNYEKDISMKELYETQPEDFIDGVDPRKLKKWWNEKDSLVSKMIKFLYNQQEELSIEEFYTKFNYNGTLDQFKDNIKNGASVISQYGQLWIHKNHKISLNKNIKKAINNF